MFGRSSETTWHAADRNDKRFHYVRLVLGVISMWVLPCFVSISVSMLSTMTMLQLAGLLLPKCSSAKEDTTDQKLIPVEET